MPGSPPLPGTSWHTVLTAAMASPVWKCTRANILTLIILDLMLPPWMYGGRKRFAPAIHPSYADRAQGGGDRSPDCLGADDYLVKPFSTRGCQPG